MNHKDSFDTLQSYFVGKTIQAVEPPDASACIARFILTDGTAFRLHATDLGYWIEDTAPKDGAYRSFNAAVIDYTHHMYSFKEYDVPLPKVEITDGTIWITAPDERSFVIERKFLSEWEQKVANHPKGKELIVKAVAVGDYWRSIFFKENGCPKEIALEHND
jgi:hypothetical protein